MKKGKIMKADQDEKRIRKMKWMEVAMVVAVIVLCATLILRLANGDWLGALANALYLVVVYVLFKQMHTTRLLMHYVNILETERDYYEKRIEAYEKTRQAQEEAIANLKQMVANKDKIVSNQESIIANTERMSKNWEKAVNRLVCEKVEDERFIPSEGGE